MLKKQRKFAQVCTQGFSLIEVLVSLVVVSLAAVNMTGLQRKIAEQQGNNIMHSYVISLAIRKMEAVLSLGDVDDLIGLNNASETLVENNKELMLHWHVSSIDNGVDLGEQFKKVEMDIVWADTQGEEQTFHYSRQINVGLLSSLNEQNTELANEIIVSALNTNEVIHFDPTMNYQEDSFVIYDGYLYKALATQIAGGDLPHLTNYSESGLWVDGNGWQGYGRIDNPKLAETEHLRTQFLK